MSAPAMGGAKEQVARLLTLVPYLHSREQVRLEEAAAALGVPPAQLLRDLRVLLMCGLPGGYPDDLIDVDLDALEGPVCPTDGREREKHQSNLYVIDDHVAAGGTGHRRAECA